MICLCTLLPAVFQCLHFRIVNILYTSIYLYRNILDCIKIHSDDHTLIHTLALTLTLPSSLTSPSGWIKIHSDDHTEAYKIWSDGFKHIPSDKRLERQFLKVKAWQCIYFSNDHWNKARCIDGTDSKDCQDCEIGSSSAGSSCESIITSALPTVDDGVELGCSSDVLATRNSSSSYEYMQPCLSDLIGKIHR